MRHLRRKFHYKQLDSTSAFLKCRRFSLRNFSFVSADYQTDGHGRMGRIWNSNPNENLLFSFLIKDKNLIEKFTSLSICCSVSILKILKQYGIKNLSIKWPNDVYVNDQKICGILLESISNCANITELIIGIGINVNSENFNGVYNAPPTSMFLQLKKEISIKQLKKKVYKQIKKDILSIKNGSLEYLYIARENNYLKDKKVFANINNEKCEVLVKDIADDNSLICYKNEKEIQLLSGEITFQV